MRLVFMGTPDFSVPALEALVGAGHDVLCAVTQPDRPKGRGNRETPPPVKVRASELGIPVEQPERVRDAGFVARLRAMAPDCIVVVAFGQILPQDILDIPQFGCVNIHASLLPKYRGAAPIQWAVICGETATGVTTMLMDVGLDTGDILEQAAIPIAPGDTGGTLHDKLARLGAGLIVTTLEGLEKGTVKPTPQKEWGSDARFEGWTQEPGTAQRTHQSEYAGNDHSGEVGGGRPDGGPDAGGDCGKVDSGAEWAANPANRHVMEISGGKTPPGYAPMLTKAMGEIDWGMEAADIEGLVRGLDPWPGAYTYLGGKMLKVWGARAVGATALHETAQGQTGCETQPGIEAQPGNEAQLGNEAQPGIEAQTGNGEQPGIEAQQRTETKLGSEAKPGVVAAVSKGILAVQTGKGLLALDEVQFEGKKRLPAGEFLRGYEVHAGDMMGMKGD